MTSDAAAAVDSYWIPLGADAHVVRLSGKAYEALKALVERRPRMDLYHAALQVTLPDQRWVIESAPVANRPGWERGAVATGPVGVRLAGRFRVFRYEIRRWLEGSIPDIREAVGGPTRVDMASRRHIGCSSWCRRFRLQRGAGTSCAPARCGTPTRSFPGCSRARASRPTPLARRVTAERRAGRRVSSWRVATATPGEGPDDPTRRSPVPITTGSGASGKDDGATELVASALGCNRHLRWVRPFTQRRQKEGAETTEGGNGNDECAGDGSGHPGVSGADRFDWTPVVLNVHRGTAEMNVPVRVEAGATPGRGTVRGRVT